MTFLFYDCMNLILLVDIAAITDIDSIITWLSFFIIITTIALNYCVYFLTKYLG